MVICCLYSMVNSTKYILSVRPSWLQAFKVSLPRKVHKRVEATCHANPVFARLVGLIQMAPMVFSGKWFDFPVSYNVHCHPCSYFYWFYILWAITCGIQRRHFHSCFRGRCRHEQEVFSLCRIALCSLWAKSSLKNHLTLTGQVWDTLYKGSKLRSDSSLSLLWLLNSFG